MRDHLRLVRMFGRTYFWHAEPGHPLQLLPAVPWPTPCEVRPEDLYSELLRLYARPLPHPEEIPVSGYPTPGQRKQMQGVKPGTPPTGPAGASSANPKPKETT